MFERGVLLGAVVMAHYPGCCLPDEPFLFAVWVGWVVVGFRVARARHRGHVRLRAGERGSAPLPMWAAGGLEQFVRVGSVPGELW